MALRRFARHLSADASDRSRHVHQAAELFERLGCTADVTRGREAVACNPVATEAPTACA